MKFKNIDEAIKYAFRNNLKHINYEGEDYYFEDIINKDLYENIPTYKLGGKVSFEEIKKKLVNFNNRVKWLKGGIIEFKKGGDVSYPGAGTKDACYKKGVEKYGKKTSAYRSGFISKCRKAKMKKS